MMKRGPVPILVGIGVALILLLVLVYWFWIRPVPNYPRLQRPLPKPNARDDFMAAGKLCAATGGSKILGRDGKPIRRNGRELYAGGAGVSVRELRVVVTRNRPALARLRQGFGKSFGTPPVADVAELCPELPQYRDLARVLVAEGKLAEQEGRQRDALRSYLDCLRLGSMVPRGGALIHGLVGVAIHAIGLTALEGAINRVDGRAAAAAAREMGRLERMNVPLAEHLIEEREVLTATMQAFIRDPGGTLERMNAAEGGQAPDEERRAAMDMGMRLMPKKWVVDNVRGYLDQLAEASRRPYYARPPAPPLPKDPLSRILLPVYDQAALKWVQRDALWRIAATRLALRAYEKRHSTVPPTLQPLVPTYLPAVPQDPYAPKPLVYRGQAGRPLVYSRGPDGDDDGGRDLGRKVEANSDGDVMTNRLIKKE
jgi:hypothetical protein